ncbi:MAG: sensor histidine kinase [Planctomycetota bacterium]
MAVVIVPTVGLLWFMVQAVRNERLAVREKLVNVYTDRIKTSVSDNLGTNWIELNLTLAESDAVLVYDSNDMLTFPVADIKGEVFEDVFNAPFTKEYIENDPAGAIVEYSRIADSALKDTLRIKADIAQARCMHKLNRPGKAIEKLRSIVLEYSDETIFLRTQKCRARLLLLELCRQTEDRGFRKELSETFEYVYRGMDRDDEFVLLGRKSHADKYIPSSVQLLVLERFLEYAEDIQQDSSFEKQIKRAKWLKGIIEKSLEMASIYENPSFVYNPSVTRSHVFELDTNEQLYGQYSRISSYLYFEVFTRETVARWHNSFVESVKEMPLLCRIYDAKGRLVTGTAVNEQQEPFIKMDLDVDYLPGWAIELYLESDDVFAKAAEKRITVYVWSGILVVVLILTAGGFAGRWISNQIKLNKLKNDFIATVSHELKTPLASIRVLVDTLLEGNIKDQGQVTDYLQLTSKENTRLSRLIDNFLTFSRMERNKHAFDIRQSSPVEIAQDAVDAVKQQHTSEKCNFEMTGEDDLTDVLADHDSMVMVLVNLLDNACKYSSDDKRINLRIFAEKEYVCFSVKDNGIGIPRRALKKIFSRFYQVDQSLTRTAEGCGLGLSIVKFIVDAHEGKIDVESVPGKGSTFTVRIPNVK